jgi:hypothetical protein
LVQEAVRSGSDTQVAYTKVQEMARPDHQIAYQTIKDAAATLTQRWTCIMTGQNRDGQKALKIAVADIPRELTRVCEQDLGRDGLTKELISRIEQEGGSA